MINLEAKAIMLLVPVRAGKFMIYMFSGGQGCHTSSDLFGCRCDMVSEVNLSLGSLLPNVLPGHI